MAVNVTPKDRVTQEELHGLETRLGKKIDDSVAKAVDELSGIIQDFAGQVDERFNRLEADFARLQNTLDAFLKRLDDVEKDNFARDAQFARLLAWAEKVAKVTGVKLEY
jgi:septal ring factor EnvC (AmiA/AmiB activator)